MCQRRVLTKKPTHAGVLNFNVLNKFDEHRDCGKLLLFQLCRFSGDLFFSLFAICELDESIPRNPLFGVAGALVGHGLYIDGLEW